MLPLQGQEAGVWAALHHPQSVWKDGVHRLSRWRKPSAQQRGPLWPNQNFCSNQCHQRP